jgi:hypothetical protein
MRRNCEDRLLRLIEIGQIGIPHDTVEIEEQHQACPARPLVAVGQRMVPCNMTSEHGRLVDQVWVEVLSAEARLGSVERGIRKIDASRHFEDLSVNPGDLFGQPEESWQ